MATEVGKETGSIGGGGGWYGLGGGESPPLELVDGIMLYFGGESMPP